MRPRLRGTGSLRCSRGSNRFQRCVSREVLVSGARDPCGESLRGALGRQESVEQPLEVVGQVVSGDLQTSYLAAETYVRGESAAELDVKALDSLAGGVGD